MQDGISKDILQIIDNACVYTKHELNSNVRLEDLALDSIIFVQIIVGIEERFGIEFPMEDLSEDNFIYISDIENRVRELIGQNNIS